MNISHLTHSDDGIRCKCGYEFEVSRHELADPQRLVERKERIASKHVCRPAKLTPKAKPDPRVFDPASTWRHPVGGAQLSHYYSQAMRRQMSA
jgi:hypothetical protein